MGRKIITVEGTPPPGRNGHTATLAKDDDEGGGAAGRIIIIGGWLGSGPLAASDVHVLELHCGTNNDCDNRNNDVDRRSSNNNDTMSLRWYQPPMMGVPPGPCNMHSADFVPKRREVYVFRGGNGREYLNDLHALHVDTYQWRRVQTTGEIPQQRANHSSAFLEETGELFVFGGWNGRERLNDIHILDTETSNWTRPDVGGCCHIQGLE
ncbi:Kelch motif [Fragilaria crotonensis]|nr:Kelch motif [Fragilaria crotonensis]